MRNTEPHTRRNILICLFLIVAGCGGYIWSSPSVLVQIHTVGSDSINKLIELSSPPIEKILSLLPEWFGPQMYTSPDYAILAYGVTFFLIFMYFMPTLVALKNHNKIRKSPTFFVNLFFGWTIIGWFIAFGMGASSDRF